MTTAEASTPAEIADLSVHELNVRIVDDIINTRNNVPPIDAQLRAAMLDELHGRALVDTCGRPWVAEIQSCPRCHRPAVEHPERTADMTAVPAIPSVQPLPFLLPASNLAPGDVVADSADGIKGGTVAALTGRGGTGLVEVAWTDHSRGAFHAGALVEVTSRALGRLA